MPRIARLAHISAVAFALVACSDSTVPATGPEKDRPLDPGAKVTAAVPTAAQQELDAIGAEQRASASMTADAIAAKYAVSRTTTLGYDPATAANLDLIDRSSLKLSAAELEVLKARGFAISSTVKYPTFAYGYKDIYAADLPVYISADSILEAVHRSYDAILKHVEQNVLVPDLRSMLTSMRTKLAVSGHARRADADMYLAVALSLLDESAAKPVAGADAVKISDFAAKAKAAAGRMNVEIFDVARDVDFSQFKPRGHYTDSEELGRYFRATMWLARIDFRLMETQSDGTMVFRRKQLESALLLRQLMDDAARKNWERIDATVGAFVGEHDDMTPVEADAFLSGLGLTADASLDGISDATLVQAIVDGGYGKQRILSQVIINGGMVDTLPLSRTFALLGQRYVFDSHVFSNVVYDRVKSERMLPNPLDAAFAAFANDDAARLLDPEIRRYDYAPDLHMMRFLGDRFDASVWGSSIYNVWLDALRQLSPDSAVSDPHANGLPAVVGTEAWGRRMLNTQLASWAELRHDTILYAKQSYTSGSACEFPDAYVDPYPKFFARLAAMGAKGAEVMSALGGTYAEAPTKYFQELSRVAEMLRGMAESERTGAPFSAEQMNFVNQAVSIQSRGCTADQASATGWYGSLFFDPFSSVKFDPTIADVHTQVTEPGGADIGRVLHVGTGYTRAMIVTVDTCSGPKAYAGLASSYFEKITEHYDRLDDPRWEGMLTNVAAPPDDVSWMKDLLGK